MASVREIVAQIEQLSPTEFAELRDWLEDRADEARWDELFARPAPAIERMAEEALAEHRAGRTTRLDPDEL